MTLSRQTSIVFTSSRKTAITVGVLYLITHITSIGAGLLYSRLLNTPAYLSNPGSDGQVLLAGFMEVILVIAIVGTGTLLYPFLHRQNEGVALSYLALRTSEAVVLAIGIIPLLVIVTLHQISAVITAVDQATLVAIHQTLVSFHNWLHILGANFIYGIHTVLLAYLLYKSRLVSRYIPILCLIGGPVVFIISALKMFGVISEASVWMLFAALAAFAWELSLAGWLIVKGIHETGLSSEQAKTTTND